MALNLAQVRAFVEVIDTGGFLEAARNLHCSQPTVTQLLRKLENDLGAQLVVRDRRRSVPTPVGASFLPHARRLLMAEERAVASVMGRSLTVGASGNVGAYILPRYLKLFSDRCGFAPEMVIASNPEVADRLEVGDVDVAVMEWWDGRAGFKAEPWQRERLVVIVAPDHPWARDREIPRNWLLEVALIGGETGSGTGHLLQAVYGRDSERLRISMNLGSTAAVKGAVKAGLGVSLVPVSSVSDEVAAGTLCAIDIAGKPLVKDLVVVKPESVPSTAPAARFHDLLREQVS